MTRAKGRILNANLNEQDRQKINAQLDFDDPDNTNAQITYTVTALPANGTLFRSAIALGIGGTFTQADIVGNLISYTPNGSETTNDQFGFSVSVYLEAGPAPADALPSSIVDLTADTPRLLRAGGIPLEKLREVVPGLLGPEE